MLLALILLAQDPLQDPASGWKTFKAGAYVKMKSVTRVEGKEEVVGEVKITLVENGGGKLVLETETTVRKETKKERREIPIKPDKKTNVTWKETARGNENVGQLACAWMESEVETTEGGYATKGTTKVWTCAQVPGGIAKLVVKIQQPQTLEMELEIVEFKP